MIFKEEEQSGFDMSKVRVAMCLTIHKDVGYICMYAYLCLVLSLRFYPYSSMIVILSSF